VSVIEPIGPRPVDPAHRQLAPPAVRERYQGDPRRDTEQRRQQKRRPEPPPSEETDTLSEHIDVRV